MRFDFCMLRGYITPYNEVIAMTRLGIAISAAWKIFRVLSEILLFRAVHEQGSR